MITEPSISNVDDLPWWWADVSDLNTIDLAGLPAGQHKVLIELVTPEHHLLPGCAACSQTVTFTVVENKVPDASGHLRSK